MLDGNVTICCMAMADDYVYNISSRNLQKWLSYDTFVMIYTFVIVYLCYELW